MGAPKQARDPRQGPCMQVNRYGANPGLMPVILYRGRACAEDDLLLVYSLGWPLATPARHWTSQAVTGLGGKW